MSFMESMRLPHDFMNISGIRRRHLLPHLYLPNLVKSTNMIGKAKHIHPPLKVTCLCKQAIFANLQASVSIGCSSLESIELLCSFYWLAQSNRGEFVAMNVDSYR